MVRRLMIIPVFALVAAIIRVQLRSWCQILSHDPVMDAESGLMCRRCGHIVTPPEDDR